ncbi:MAG TPA: FHA domain-containing protein [Gemmatimonadaceae bacterium]|nr:FHA domain-containing protein [Gemmatimonadaceae bacterium]
MSHLVYGDERRELEERELVVGSGALAGWRILHADLAARHFAVRRDPGGGLSIHPFSAQHVVVVNGRQVPVHGGPLAPGDVVAAGNARFSVADGETAAAAAAAAATPPRAHLVLEREGRAYPLNAQTVTIGRDASSIVHLRDPSVSRFHADVRTEAGAFVLYSMGSAGTRINGFRVSSPHVLEEGDRIEIGDVALRFVTGALPPTTEVADDLPDLDEEVSRRPTGAITSVERVSLPPAGRRGLPAALLLAVGVVMLAIVWIILQR